MPWASRISTISLPIWAVDSTEAPPSGGLYGATEHALLESDPALKCELASRLYEYWQSGELVREESDRMLGIDDPGRPPRPVLVDPRDLARRSPATAQGRIHLLHAFAHIEFCAINIALDAVYRFRQMPDDFVRDWLRVASEEALHFRLLQGALRQRGSHYGACDAHGGLWDMVVRTRHDVLHRMALVPRVMEARGLDVTPAMMRRFEQAGAPDVVEILGRIYADEIGHVRIGNHWYQWLCAQQGREPKTTFRELIDSYMEGGLRGPFNWQARLEAGFDEEELTALEADRT